MSHLRITVRNEFREGSNWGRGDGGRPGRMVFKASRRLWGTGKEGWRRGVGGRRTMGPKDDEVRVESRRRVPWRTQSGPRLCRFRRPGRVRSRSFGNTRPFNLYTSSSPGP